MQFSRYINLSFTIAGLILWITLQKATAMFIEVAGSNDLLLAGDAIRLSGVVGAVLAAGTTFYLWQRKDVQTWAGEIAVELSKVTWPKWPETRQHTIVVIVFSLILSGILAIFDFFWKWLTDLILLGA